MEPIVRSIHSALQSPNGTLLACSIRSALRSGRALKIGSASVLALGMTLGAGASRGAETLPELTTLEEVIITAQFREETLQTVPVAITALDADQLRVRGLDTLHDLTSAAPNTTITRGTQTFGPGAQIFIRGVGQIDGHLGFEPGVGVYVDDVYYGVVLGSDFELSDSRVEILRGPQGTLAGKNSIGGSLKLFSTKPSAESDAYVSGSFGDYNRVQFNGAGNITLTDGLYLRLSGYSKQIDGYVDRVDFGCLNPGSGVPSVVAPGGSCKLGTEGGEDVQGARIALRWMGNESFENNLVMFGTRERNEPTAGVILALNNAALVPGGGAQFITAPESYITYSTYIIPSFTDPAAVLNRPGGRPAGSGTHPAFPIDPASDVDSYGVSNNFVWKISDTTSLTSITGYRDNEGSYGIYQGGGPFPTSVLITDWEQDQLTQELRLNFSAFKTDFTVGAYYFTADGLYGGLKVLSPGAPFESLFNGDDPVESESTSAFAHGVFHATDKLSLIAGVRYTDEEKTYTFQRQNPFAADGSYSDNGGLGPSYITNVGVIDGTSSTFSGDEIDYRAGVQYEWTPDFMTYVQYSTGFRGGGVNIRPFSLDQLVNFGTETVKAAELGAKTTFLENRVRINTALFFNQYDDIIFTNQTPTPQSPLNLTPTNVGNADVMGAEVEVATLFGGLQVDLTASYLDFEFTSVGNNTGVNLGGVTVNNKSPHTPETKFAVGMQYAIPVGGLGNVTPRVDANYQDEYFTDIANTQAGRIDSRTLVNARLTWTSPTGAWEAAVVGTNILDKYYILNTFSNNAAGGARTFTSGQPGAPRQIYGTIRHRF
jgi:iron complex outermembrane receptor protein